MTNKASIAWLTLTLLAIFAVLAGYGINESNQSRSEWNTFYAEALADRNEMHPATTLVRCLHGRCVIVTQREIHLIDYDGHADIHPDAQGHLVIDY